MKVNEYLAIAKLIVENEENKKYEIKGESSQGYMTVYDILPEIEFINDFFIVKAQLNSFKKLIIVDKEN